MGRKIEESGRRQFLEATEDEVRQMIAFLDTYPYTDGQITMYLTWARSMNGETPVDFVLRNMNYVGKSNARANRGERALLHDHAPWPALEI